MVESANPETVMVSVAPAVCGGLGSPDVTCVAEDQFASVIGEVE